MRMRALMILCMVPVVLLFGGCNKSNPAGGNNNTTYYTLTVTLQPPAGLAKKAYLKQVASSGVAGKKAYLKLVSSGGAAASPALYSGSAVFPDTGNASVSIDSIASGTYHRYMFIDMDGDAATTGYAPDSGDYAVDAEIPVTGNVNNTIASGDWSGTSGNLGWMISASGGTSNPPYYIWHTTNGGASWSVQYTDNTQGAYNAIQFIDQNNGWVVGNGKILKTTDGGNNWTLVTNTGINIATDYSSIKCLFFLNADTGWIPTSQGSWPNHVVLHTTNGGNSWTQQSFGFDGAIFSINFWDANNGWFSGEQCVQNCSSGIDSLLVFAGIIANTTTGGESGWGFQSNPLGSNGSTGKVQFVSSTEGWISVGRGQLLHTTDAGANWTVVTPFPNDTVMSMSDPAVTMWWVNQTHGWKINWFGTGFSDAHGAVIYQTTDGGGTWARKVLSTVAGEMGLQVQFVDENNGWASIYNMSSGNMILMRTTDGGNNWSPIIMTPGVGGLFYFQ